MSTYRIEMLNEKEIDKALDFLRKFFFRDEPLNEEKKILEHSNDTCKELEIFSLNCLYRGYSLKAVNNSNGQLIGLCLNDIVSKIEKKIITTTEECRNEKFAKIEKLLETVDEQANIFGRFSNIDRLLNIKILSVDSAFRGQGVAKALVQYSRQMAIENGLKMIRADCSSYYSAKIFDKLGFKCVYSLEYEKYCDKNGPVFRPAYPHKGVHVYVEEMY